MGRLTPEWTETLEEAFGPSGAKGREGELFLIKVLESWGWEVTDHQNDTVLQNSGIDITFRDPKWYKSYTGDAKNNMRNNSVFRVYKSWLFKSKADRIWHVNPDTGWVAWYGVDQMKQVYDTSKEYMMFGCKNSPSFVRRVRYEGK